MYDEKYASEIELYGILSTMAHELSHQWTGNLVTPKRWDDLWLNEGFATFMSYEGVDSQKPGWNIFDFFVLDEMHDVFNLDCLRSSHPISIKVNDPSEIREIFDAISYSKGASVIRMLTHIIGIEIFKKGMHSYLNAFEYSNADQSDLWRYLQAASDENNHEINKKINVKSIMDSWTLKEGYPLITITRDYQTNKVRFSQARFLLNANETDKEMLLRTQYEVPISYTFESEPNWEPETKLWLHKKNERTESYTIKELSISKDDWLIANLQQTGYYRVTYDEKNWKLLVQQLQTNHTKIHRINRAQLLNDLFHLAENGVVKYALALSALEYLKNEKESLPWLTVRESTNLIDKMLQRSNNYGEWQKFIRKTVRPAYEINILKKNKNFQDNQMQRAIVNLACAHNLHDCLSSSVKLFNEFMENVNQNKTSNPIPQNLRQTFYCTAIANGSELEWDFLFNLYLKEQNANERTSFLKGLTCTRVPWLIVRYLKWMFDEKSGIKTQDAISAFASVAEQNYAKDIAFNFLRSNWNLIYSIHGKHPSIARIVKTLDSLNTEFDLELVKSFYRSIGSNIGMAKRAFSQVIEQIESNIVWMKKYEKQINDYLKESEKKTH